MIGFGNLLVLKFWDVDYHTFHINEFKKLFKSVHTINYDSYFNQHGLSKLESHIVDCIEKYNIDIVIVWLFLNNFELSLEFINKIREKAYVVLWFFDDEVFFHSFNKFYAQVADAVVTTSYYERYAYEQLDIPSVLYYSSYSKNDYYPMNVTKTIDVSFIGISEGRPDRSEYITHLRSNGIQVATYGSGFEGGFVSQKKMNEIFSQSKINLNFTQMYQMPELYRDNPFLPRIRQNKGRPIEIALTKSFCLSQYAPPVLKLFEINKEIVVFDTKDELLGKVRYYLKYTRERERIAANAYRRAMRNYESGIYLKRVFDELFNKLLANKKKRFLYNEIYSSSSFRTRTINFFKKNIIEQIRSGNFRNAKESMRFLKNNNCSFIYILLVVCLALFYAITFRLIKIHDLVRRQRGVILSKGCS